MKHFTNLKTWLLAAVLMLGVGSVWGQGSESFSHTSTSTSYVTITWTGDNGLSWSATDSRGDQVITTGNKAITVKKGAIEGDLTAEEQSAGIGTMSFDYKIPYSDATKDITATITAGSKVITHNIGKLTVGTVYNTGAIEINSSDASKIIIAITSSAEGARLTIDNLVWTANSGGGTPCTPADLSFATKTVTKSILDEEYTQTATSLNGTTAIVYSSSDENVAEVDENTGYVLFTGVGTATITASQAAGTHGGVDYCTASVSYDLTIEAISTPVANAATSVSETGFTANWNAVSGVSNYKLEVYSGSIALNENFSGFTAGEPNASANGTDVSSSLDTYTTTTGWAGSKVYQAGGAVKMGTSAVLGYLETPALNLAGATYTLTFKAMAWSGDSQNLKIYLDDTLIETITDLNNDANYVFKSYSVNIPIGTANSTIKFEGNAASKGRFFLDDVKIANTIDAAGSPFSVTGTSKAVTGLLAGTEYFYAVQAIAGGVESAWSNEISVTTSGTGAPVPTITVTETSFSLSAEVGETADDIFEVEAVNLTADIELAITGTHAAMFSYNVDKDFDRTGGIVLVTYAPTAAGSHTATLTISSTGAVSRQIALNGTATADPIPVVMPDVIISEVYGGGGNNGATYTHDFIELYNTTDDNVIIEGWSVQYYSATGISPAETNITIIPNGKYIPAKTHFLIQAAAGTGGTDELILPDVVGAIAMSGTNGKVILFNTDEAQTVDKDDIGSILGNTYFVDYVPYGTAVPVWGSAMGSTTNVKSATRKKDGSGNYIYTGDIGNDFELADPSPQSTLLTAVSSTTTSDTRIYATNKLVYVHTTVGTQIEIYNIAGQKVISQTATVDGFNRIPVSHTGILVVKAGEVVGKVVN